MAIKALRIALLGEVDPIDQLPHDQTRIFDHAAGHRSPPDLTRSAYAPLFGPISFIRLLTTPKRGKRWRWSWTSAICKRRLLVIRNGGVNVGHSLSAAAPMAKVGSEGYRRQDVMRAK
jgi:hypothetical protein